VKGYLGPLTALVRSVLEGAATSPELRRAFLEGIVRIYFE
jgi:hypothetical protein